MGGGRGPRQLSGREAAARLPHDLEAPQKKRLRLRGEMLREGKGPWGGGRGGEKWDMLGTGSTSRVLVALPGLKFAHRISAAEIRRGRRGFWMKLIRQRRSYGDKKLFRGTLRVLLRCECLSGYFVYPAAQE